MDWVGGRGEGHGDAEVRDDGFGAVGGRFQRGESVGADRGGGFQVVDGLGYAADRELRGPVGALDAGLGGRAEAGVNGEGEVDGGGPAHAKAWGADAGYDVDGRRDGNFEVSGGVSGDVGLGLFRFDVIEERDVVVRDAAEREAEAGCVV